MSLNCNSLDNNMIILSDGGPEEYEVETIISHVFDDNENCFKYLVKWKGYGIQECTWEPVSNLFKAISIVKQYWVYAKITSNFDGEELSEEEIEEAFKYLTNEKQLFEYKINLHYPNKKIRDWNTKVDSIKNVFKDDNGELIVLVKWKTGVITVHPIELVAKKLPQKLITYFEKETVFMG
ncbi:hypothetical protein K502DRAFT_327792 [Neoconidiobolus thromboides FSU 785]|nr:hypothetical protein K502DRAFT_327792 [Neoconidiobolus thromboides FSU 785]